MLKSKFTILYSLFTLMAFGQEIQWSIVHPLNGNVLFMGEKGSVQEVLIQTGELPDPFVGENEAKFTWIEKHDWTFVSKLTVSATELNHEFVELEFPSIDTYAKIYLNGNLIGETANAFHAHRFQVKDKLQEGDNELKVVFQSPVNYHRASFQKRSVKLPAPNDVGEIAVASMSRKPQYQFGWDWALRMNTIGFWKPAKLHFYKRNRIIQANMETQSIETDHAKLKLSAYFSVQDKAHYSLKSSLFGEFNHIEVHNGTMHLHVQLENPKLWWPRGQGDAFLYTDTLILIDEQGLEVDRKIIRFGVRTSKLVQEKDQWGTSFYFKINGRNIFAKGANYIPQDVFPARVTDEAISYLIQQMHESNFNMVRVWGGGYYPDEIFYTRCDELGIMVWQDLMFACAMYPGNNAFFKLVETELNEVIPRISAHPSVVYFNGNNEVDVAWKNWGFQVRYMIGPRKQREMEHDYRRLFKELAPATIRKHSNIPYVHTSPLSNWGKDENFKHGTMHYWGVWHGKDPIEDFGKKSGRFNAEYGFQSFPEFSTLKSFSTEKDWDLNSPVMKQHQKSYVGNGMIKKHSDMLFGSTTDFKQFVYFSQLTQAKAVGIAISGHRSQLKRCMGTLYWQFNDCWPAPTWSSIDYYNNWKALQYQVQADYEDVAVIEQTKTIGQERYLFISEDTHPFQSAVNYQIYNLNGKLLLDQTDLITINGPLLQEMCIECQAPMYKTGNYIVRFKWNDHLGNSKSRIFLHEVKPRQKATKDQVSFELQSIDTLAHTAVIRIKTTAFLANCWIYANTKGIRFDRNFVHLLPGEHDFVIHFQEIPRLENFELIWR